MTQMLSTQFFLSNLEANYDTMQPLKLWLHQIYKNKSSLCQKKNQWRQKVKKKFLTVFELGINKISPTGFRSSRGGKKTYSTEIGNS
jgi:hypothetical protein